MDKIFYPESIVIWGLSSKANNTPRLIAENLIRWGFKGRLFGVHPKGEEPHVSGIRIYRSVSDLPVVPDLAVFLLPAKYIPDAVKDAGEFGIRRVAILSGGFNESGEEGQKLADQLLENTRKYNIRFVGPNSLAVANTANGLCLPFLPLFVPPKGGMSIISQSGALGVFLWNLLADENVGFAKYASIGNKLDLNEIDCIRYMGNDPETSVICIYLESINNGRELIDVAMEINKPVVVFKANTTNAGSNAAMSHTAAISNNDAVVDSAFERAGIIRIDNFSDFIAAAKIFELPPLRGDRLMIMSPAGGFTVILADLCDKEGFKLADPGDSFYEELKKYVNSGVIKISNPLDLGDIYNPKVFADIFNSVLHNDNVDGAVFITQNPVMPKNDNPFYRMFKTDISKEIIGSIRSSNKPFAACLFAPEKTMNKMRRNVTIPVFDSPETMMKLLKKQRFYYQKKEEGPFIVTRPEGMDMEGAASWIKNHPGITGEDAIELLEYAGISNLGSSVAKTGEQAVSFAEKTGYPVVMKVVSPDAIHKSEVEGVIIGINNNDEALKAFNQIENNLKKHKPDARFDGVRVMAMAGDGYDMFIGANVDDAFGPVSLFGFGGIWIEVFSDVENILCPSNRKEIESKVKRLKSYKILQGTRGQGKGDIDGYIDMIERVSHLMAAFPEIKELDLNPVRVFSDGSGVAALDVRIRVDQQS